MFSVDAIKVPDAVREKVDVATQALRSYHTELQGALQEMLSHQQYQLEAGKKRAEELFHVVEINGLVTRGNELYARVGTVTAEWQAMVQEHLSRVIALVGSKTASVRSGNGKAAAPAKASQPVKKKASPPAKKKARKPAKTKARKTASRKASPPAKKKARKPVKKATRKKTTRKVKA